MGIPSSFLRYTTGKLLKRGVIMNIPSTCNQYDGYTRAEGDTTHKQQSNIMIWYDWYRGHDVWTLGSARRDVIGGMAGRFTRKERGAVQSQIDTMDAAVDYATNNTMPEAVMDNSWIT
jgi:hypothetical protein